jgi:hypothetical protein
VGPNQQSPATSDATKSVPKEPSAANPSKNPKNSEKECTKLPKQPKVGTEAVGRSARPPKQHKEASKAEDIVLWLGERLPAPLNSVGLAFFTSSIPAGH